MIPTQLLDGLSEQLGQLLGQAPQQTRDELRNSINLILQSAFSRLELVSRDEFDAQAEVLQRTRALVTELEQRLAALEQNAGN